MCSPTTTNLCNKHGFPGICVCVRVRAYVCVICSKFSALKLFLLRIYSWPLPIERLCRKKKNLSSLLFKHGSTTLSVTVLMQLDLHQ